MNATTTKMFTAVIIWAVAGFAALALLIDHDRKQIKDLHAQVTLLGDELTNVETQLHIDAEEVQP